MKTLSTSLSITTAAFTLALAAVGCDRTEPASTTHTTSGTEQTGRSSLTAPEPIPAPAALSSEDKDFITKATQGGMLEVALGHEVSAKGVSPDIKAFGDRMVTDHAKADDELKRLAANKGVTAPVALDKDHQSKLDEMSRLSGEKLDREYAHDMVKDHEDDVDDFKKAADDLKDPDLRAWAAKTLPVLEGHLAMAKSIDAQAKGKKAPK